MLPHCGRSWMLNLGCWTLNVPKSLFMLAIRGYQLTLSPLLAVLCGPAGGCRYSPTCSAYAMQALREHGAVAGTILSARRICRCHPWGGCGHDPVPPKQPVSTPRAHRRLGFHG